MSFLELERATFKMSCEVSRGRNAMVDPTRIAPRSNAMLSARRLDSADDPAILFPNEPDQRPADTNPVVDASEADERLWACHRAWDM